MHHDHVSEVDLTTLTRPYDAELIDVREADEYAAGHVPGARLVPMSEITQRLDELPRDRPLYVICAVGQRSLAVADFLVRAGFEAHSVAGGTYGWMQAGHPVETGP
ncbi:rhodanese-like domain-containing protein [Nocardioides caldifontis]|uniref:rhodanese-like domain-containing protein n=1 Tax=Nocardioides caldifontis TaxID=2588938 RepID=UPI0011DFD353|nr:rhodanese-like domain-containing protein [Nocardioides caldifontis]